MTVSVLDFSAYVGMVAVDAVTLNMTLGMLIAMRYSPVRSWPHRQFNHFLLHKLVWIYRFSAFNSASTDSSV